jgi:hypothetical protein
MVERKTVLARRNNCDDVWEWSIDLSSDIKKSIEGCFSGYKIIKTDGDINSISTSSNLKFNSEFNTLTVSSDDVINLLGYERC